MTILIESLAFEAILGILEHERLNAQRIVIDCTLDYDYAEGRFIDYADAAGLIVTTMQRERFELIETALDTLAFELKTAFPAARTLTLTIRKPDILPGCTVGVRQAYNF